MARESTKSHWDSYWQAHGDPHATYDNDDRILNPILDLGDVTGKRILEVLENGALASPMVKGKGSMILKGEFPTSFPLKHMQKDMRLAVALGDYLYQPLHTAAAANETFKNACKYGLAEEDFTAVFKAIT